MGEDDGWVRVVWEREVWVSELYTRDKYGVVEMPSYD